MSNIKITEQQIKELLAKSEYKTFHAVFGKLTVMVCKLPNGYTLVGSSGYVDPKNYDSEIGEQICKQQIEDQLWKMEGYALTSKVYGSPNIR